MSVGKRELHSKGVYFIGMVVFEWFNKGKIGNIDILALGTFAKNSIVEVQNSLREIEVG